MFGTPPTSADSSHGYVPSRHRLPVVVGFFRGLNNHRAERRSNKSSRSDLESEAIDDMAAERRILVDDRRPYQSTVRKPKVVRRSIREERTTEAEVGRVCKAACCRKKCLR
jgi:hypothetical protein